MYDDSDYMLYKYDEESRIKVYDFINEWELVTDGYTDEDGAVQFEGDLISFNIEPPALSIPQNPSSIVNAITFSSVFTYDITGAQNIFDTVKGFDTPEYTATTDGFSKKLFRSFSNSVEKNSLDKIK